MGSAHMDNQLDRADSYPRQLATLDPTWPGRLLVAKFWSKNQRPFTYHKEGREFQFTTGSF